MLDDLLSIHADQIERYGGSLGVRDLGLLDSARAMPEAAFAGEDLHGTLMEKAAAYLFHLVKNHPFVDGNKRVGAMAMIVFLGLNGWKIVATEDELTNLVVDVATGAASKAQIAVWLDGHTRRIRRR